MRTGTALPPTGGSFSPNAPFVQPGAPKARRQPALVALGVALIGVSAVGFVFWSQQSSTKTPVLVLAKDVPYGQKFTTSDVIVSQVALGPGVVALGDSNMGKVLTEVATTDLHAGSLLKPADVAAAPPVPTGTDVFSFSVKPEGMPTGLQTGRTVLLIANKVYKISIGDPSTAKPPPADMIPSDPPTYKATVVSINSISTSSTKITVAIQQADAVVAEELADEGRFGIVLLPAGS